MDSRRSYTKRWTLLFARYHKPSLCHLQSSAHSNRARTLDSKVCKFPFDQSNLHGNEQKEAVFCFTCLQHFAMYTRHGHQYNPNNWNYHSLCPICMAGQQQELCLSLVLQRTSQWIRAEATKPCANRKISYTISLSSLLVPPTLFAHATRFKSLQISIRSVQSAW